MEYKRNAENGSLTTDMDSKIRRKERNREAQRNFRRRQTEQKRKIANGPIERNSMNNTTLGLSDLLPKSDSWEYFGSLNPIELDWAYTNLEDNSMEDTGLETDWMKSSGVPIECPLSTTGSAITVSGHPRFATDLERNGRSIVSAPETQKCLGTIANANHATHIDEGKLAIHVAAEYGRIGIVKALIQSTVDINVQDSLGLTPLHYAARGGHGDVTMAILDAGTDVNAVDHRGWSAVHMTALAGWDITFSLLLQRGANLSLAIAARPGHFENTWDM